MTHLLDTAALADYTHPIYQLRVREGAMAGICLTCRAAGIASLGHSEISSALSGSLETVAVRPLDEGDVR